MRAPFVLSDVCLVNGGNHEGCPYARSPLWMGVPPAEAPASAGMTWLWEASSRPRASPAISLRSLASPYALRRGRCFSQLFVLGCMMQ